MPAPKQSAPADKLSAALKAYADLHPIFHDGVYLGLPEDLYHADSALGSSNIRDLLKGANVFWFKSRMNPKRKTDKKTPAKIMGSAVHKLLLEGHGPFEALYVRGPYDDDDDLTSAEKSALTKAAKNNLQENQELLPASGFDFVVGCKSILDTDPNLAGCLDNALTEVSIFWSRPDGVRVKARLDALKLRGIGDIKTIANERERELETACRLDITTYRYDIPAAHYGNGRRELGRLLDAGRVYSWIPGNSIIAAGDTHKRFLERCAKIPNFGFQLVFIPKQGAPDAWSCTLSPGNPLLDEANTDIEIAIERFKSAMIHFGPDARWTPRRTIGELYREHLPMSHGRTTRDF